MCKNSNDWKKHFYQILEEAISIVVHTLNQVQLKKDSDKNPYELWYSYRPNISYLKVFGSKCYILKESRKDKFDIKGDEGIFLGYFGEVRHIDV